MQFVAFCFIKIYMQFINIVLSFFLLNIPANTHSTRLDVEWNFFWDWLFTVKCGSDRSVVGFLDIRSNKKKERTVLLSVFSMFWNLPECFDVFLCQRLPRFFKSKQFGKPRKTLNIVCVYIYLVHISM